MDPIRCRASDESRAHGGDLQDGRPSEILSEKLQHSPDAGDNSEAAHRVSAQAAAGRGKMKRGWTYGVSR